MMDEQRQWGDLVCHVVSCKRASELPDGAVILCHGFGAPSTDLVPIAGEVFAVEPKLSNLVFVFPRAPIELDPYYDSRAWWMIDIEKIQSLMMRGEFRELADSQPVELVDRRRQLSDLISCVENEYHLSPDKIIVGGFSQGAMLATDVALHYPRQIAGLIIWSGSLIHQSAWKIGAERRSPMHIVQSHGRHDPILPFAGAEALRDMLVERGHRVDFVPFDGPHTISGGALQKSIVLMKSLFRDQDGD